MEAFGETWYNSVIKPFVDPRRIKRLTRGRNSDGSIKRGAKVVVPLKAILSFPE